MKKKLSHSPLRQQFEDELIRIGVGLMETITDDQLLLGDALSEDDIPSILIPEEDREYRAGDTELWNWETRGGVIQAIEDAHWEREQRFYERHPEERPQEEMDRQLEPLFAQLERELR